MALKQIALKIGFDLPFYTRTGWPELRTPVPYGAMLPLYGDYADGFWDKEVTEGCGNYYKAFNFKAFRSSTAIGTDLLGKQDAKINKGDEQYPYFTCELGGGMATGTANNDLPVCTYDFQAPLGEFGQPYPQYYMLRPLHLFMQDFGETLAPMEASFPAPQDLKRGQDDALRWAVRSLGDSGFIFINNYCTIYTYINFKSNSRYLWKSRSCGW